MPSYDASVLVLCSFYYICHQIIQFFFSCTSPGRLGLNLQIYKCLLADIPMKNIRYWTAISILEHPYCRRFYKIFYKKINDHLNDIELSIKNLSPASFGNILTRCIYHRVKAEQKEGGFWVSLEAFQSTPEAGSADL